MNESRLPTSKAISQLFPLVRHRRVLLVAPVLLIMGVLSAGTASDQMSVAESGPVFASRDFVQRHTAISAAAEQAGIFAAEADVTPLVAGTDSGIGFSNGPQTDFPYLAVVGRINRYGFIDALNGTGYSAVSSFTWVPNTSYHFVFVINLPQHVYSLAVSAPGQPPKTIASNYSFRTSQSSIQVLSTWTVFADIGSMRVSGLFVGAQTVPATSTWRNSSLLNQSGSSFVAEWDAVPLASAMDGVMAFSSGTQSDFTGFPCLIRFFTDGSIQARNGNNYQADVHIAYVTGSPHHFQARINLVNHTYSVVVTPAGGSPQTLASNYVFRTEQRTAGMLNNFGAIVDTSVGGMRIGNFAITGIQDTFEGAGLITSPDYYNFVPFPNGGTSTANNVSSGWEGDTGTMYAAGGWGTDGSGPCDAKTFSYRYNTRNFAFANSTISFTYRAGPFGAGGCYPSKPDDAVDLWVHYHNQYWLYAFQFDRKDGTIKWKKKVPGEGWNPPPTCSPTDHCLANRGVYYTIPTDANQPLVGAGRLSVGWNEIRSLLTSEQGKPGFPGIAHDGTTIYDFRVTVRTLSSGEVQLQAFRAGVLVFSATDDGSVGVCEPAGTTEGQDAAAGRFTSVSGYNPAWLNPIGGGAVGLRSDNLQFWVSNFVVAPQ